VPSRPFYPCNPPFPPKPLPGCFLPSGAFPFFGCRVILLTCLSVPQRLTHALSVPFQFPPPLNRIGRLTGFFETHTMSLSSWFAVSANNFFCCVIWLPLCHLFHCDLRFFSFFFIFAIKHRKRFPNFYFFVSGSLQEKHQISFSFWPTLAEFPSCNHRVPPRDKISLPPTFFVFDLRPAFVLFGQKGPSRATSQPGQTFFFFIDAVHSSPKVFGGGKTLHFPQIFLRFAWLPGPLSEITRSFYHLDANEPTHLHCEYPTDPGWRLQISFLSLPGDESPAKAACYWRFLDSRSLTAFFPL